MVNSFFKNIRHIIYAEVEKAEQTVVVAVYWFTHHGLFDLLLDKLNNGVSVELIVHNDYINNKKAGLPFQKFIDGGGKFYFSTKENPVHHKFCVIDSKVLINGSYNWTYYAEDKNRENILILRNELEAIADFEAEFDRLKELLELVTEVASLSRYEVDEFNDLDAKVYLANDLVLKAHETGNKELVDEAIDLVPDNIDIQKKAFDLDLTKKYKTAVRIGAELKDNKSLTLVPKGTMLPFIRTEVVQTVFDNQTSSLGNLHFGDSNIASQNKSFRKTQLHGLPPKPAGEAKIKYHVYCGLDGMMKVRKYSLDNGLSIYEEVSMKKALSEVFYENVM